MGFSLEIFFEELQRLIDSIEDEDAEMYTLTEYINEQQRYARECGLIPS